MQSGDAHVIDSGFSALSAFLRLNGVTAEPDQIAEHCGTTKADVKEMLYCARGLGLAARACATRWRRLAYMPMPAIAGLRAGGFILICQIIGDKALVLHPTQRTEFLTQAQFEAIWDGRLVFAERPGSAWDFGYRLRQIIANAGAGILNVARRDPVAPTESARQARDAEAGFDVPGAEAPASGDSGLAALVILLRYHGIGAEAGQIRHKMGVARIGVIEMLRCAKDLGLKARARRRAGEARQDAAAWHRGAEGRRLPDPRQGRRRTRSWCSTRSRRSPKPCRGPNSRQSGTAASS